MFYQLKEGFPFVVMDLKFIIISGYKTRTFSDTTLNLMLLWSMVEIIIKINCNDKQPNNSYHSRESGCRTKQHYIKQHYIKQKAKSSKGSKRSQWKKRTVESYDGMEPPHGNTLQPHEISFCYWGALPCPAQSPPVIVMLKCCNYQSKLFEIWIESKLSQTYLCTVKYQLSKFLINLS